MPEAPWKDLGPCQILWDNVALTPAFGTVLFRSEQTKQPIREEQHGEAKVDDVFTGRLVTIEAPFTRQTLAQLMKQIPGSTGGATNLMVPNKVGGPVYDLSKEMIIKPMIDQVASVDTSEWITVFKTYPFEKMELGFDNAGQRVVLVEFQGYPDQTSGLVGNLYRIGPA